MSSSAYHGLFVPLGCPVTVSLCLTATAVVGAWSAVAVRFSWREKHRDMRKSSGCVVGVVAMMPSLLAAERRRECYL